MKTVDASLTQRKSKKCVLSIALMFAKSTVGDETKMMIKIPRMNRANLRTRKRPRLPRMFFQRISLGSVAGLAIKMAS